MKKAYLPFIGILVVSLSLSSCFSYRQKIGKGVRVKEVAEFQAKNHYLLMGLIPLKRADINTLHQDSLNYEFHSRQTFPDMLVSVLTAGIYTPSTTTVYVPKTKYKKETKFFEEADRKATEESPYRRTRRR